MMEESPVVAKQEYPAEYFHLMHNGDGDGDGDSSSGRVHGEREGMNPRPFLFISFVHIIVKYSRRGTQLVSYKCLVQFKMFCGNLQMKRHEHVSKCLS
jgi:hypothetical protein